MKFRKREYRSQKIPELWFIDAIKKGCRTKKEIEKELNIGQTACSYKLRQMLYEGKLKRDTSRIPFVYYLKEEEQCQE